MSNKRLVVCTSSGCLKYAPKRYQELGIEQIHIIVNYDDKDYHEGLDLDPEHFFTYLETLQDPKNHLPHTAIPEAAQIQEKFQSAIDRGFDEVIVIALSSYLGGTYNFINQIADEYRKQIKITVIDAKITGFGEGLLAVEAQNLVNKGVDTVTIVKEIEWSKAHQEFIGVVSKLDFLVYNGRLKGGKAFMGKMLSICPVMHFSHEGVLEAFASVIGFKKSCEKLCEELLKLIGNRDPKDYYLWHNYTGQNTLEILKEIEKKYGITCNHEDVVMSPVSGCHTGPYLASYGLFFIRKEEEPLE